MRRNGRTTRTRHWLATAAADAALNLCVGVEEKVFVPVGLVYRTDGCPCSMICIIVDSWYSRYKYTRITWNIRQRTTAMNCKVWTQNFRLLSHHQVHPEATELIPTQKKNNNHHSDFTGFLDGTQWMQNYLEFIQICYIWRIPKLD
jgi:hypothetical protein